MRKVGNRKEGIKESKKEHMQEPMRTMHFGQRKQDRATVRFTARPTSLVTLLPVVINAHFLQLCVKQPAWKRAFPADCCLQHNQ